MKSFPVVKDFNVIKQILLYVLYCSILPPIKILVFQKKENGRKGAIALTDFLPLSVEA